MKFKLSLFCILIPYLLQAQIMQDKFLYGKMSGSLGKYPGGKYSLEFINSNNISYTLGVYGQGRRYDDLPSDYKPPNGIFSVFLFGLDFPMEERTTVYLGLGKILQTDEGKTRFNLSAGLGCNLLSYPSNFIKITPSGTSENYSYNYKKGYSIALILNPTVDLAVWRYFGFSTGLISVISPNGSSFGFEFSYMFGAVRHKKIKKRNAENV